MTTNRILLAAAAAGVVAWLAGFSGTTPTLAQSIGLLPMVVNQVTGQLAIHQPLPGTCDNINQTAAVTKGRIEISPSDGVDIPGGKSFVLTRANVSFAPFRIERHCMTEDFDTTFADVNVQLRGAVPFTGVPSGSVFAFTIPKDRFLLYEAFTANGEPESGLTIPDEDVTGTVDLVNGTFAMTVVVGTDIHIRIGCVPVLGCVVDDHYRGTLTAAMSGPLVFPDSDGDTIPDRADNCRFFPNTDQGPVNTPVVTAPPDVTLASCLDTQIGTASGTDLCDATFIAVTNNAPARFAIGGNVVTWSGQDGKGRTGTANQTVTVVDTTPPLFTSIPPNVALNDCKAADLGLPTATDDCAGAPTFTNDAPAKFMVGTTEVTWTVTDVSGNSTVAAQKQKVVVTDTVPPTVSCLLDGPPQGRVFRVSAIDACTSLLDIRLGSYRLADGERIKIEDVGRPGVRLVSEAVPPDGIKHFHVGGQAIITATDGSGNTARAICR